MATTLQPTFGLQQPEDSMEISSEYGNMDADIDIDLDAPDAPDTNMQSFHHDDHHMQEDPKSDRQDDDLMIDDSNIGDADRMMQDDAPLPQEQDEELLDFSEDEEDVPMNPVEQTQPELQDDPESSALAEPLATIQEPVEQVQSAAASQLLTEGVQPVDSEAPQTDETQLQPHPETSEPAAEQSTTDHEPDTIVKDPSDNLEPQHEAQDLIESVTVAEVAQQTDVSPTETVVESSEALNEPNDNPVETAQAVQPEPTEEEYQKQGNDAAEAVSAQEHDEESVEPSLVRQETDLSNYTVPEDYSRERQPNSPTVTGLHPTIVEYQDNEVYLFPSRDPAVPEQYLLQNENLVTTSLGDLLQACRTALGDGISEDEELVLGVEELDLYVSEDSTPAFSTSFSELLDMYLQLHKLDGNDNPTPFRVSLTTKTRFSNRLASITQAISEGKGFSQLSFLQYYEYDEPTELPDEDFDDDFDETANHDEAQEAIECGASVAEHTQAANEHEPEASSHYHGTEETNAEQTDSAQVAGDHDGEYKGDASIQHDAANDVIDQTETNQDDTQYFDAQGDESQLAGQDHIEAEDHFTAEVQHVSGDAHATAAEEVHDPTVSDQVHSAQDEQQEEYFEHQNEEEQEYENLEENVFGQGEFFDEDNYEYQDGEVAEEEGEDGDAGADEPHAMHEDSHEEAEQDDEALAPEAQDSSVAHSSGEHTLGEVPESGHSASQDSQEQRHAVDDSVSGQATDIDNETTPVVGDVNKNITKRPSLAVEDDDYDEINFDDEDGYEDEGAGLAQVLSNASSKASPGGKRSFSELDHVDDEQDTKKARAS